MNASTSMTEPQNAQLGDKRRADDDDIYRNTKTMKITHDGDVPDITIDAPASDDEKDVSKATRRKLAAKKVSKTDLMVPSATLPEDLKLIGDVPAPPAFLKARKEALSAQAGDGDAAAVLLATPTPSARTAESELQPRRSGRTRKTVQYSNKTTLPLDPVTSNNADPKEGAELPATKRAPAKPRKTRAKATSTSSPEDVPKLARKRAQMKPTKATKGAKAATANTHKATPDLESVTQAQLAEERDRQEAALALLHLSRGPYNPPESTVRESLSFLVSEAESAANAAAVQAQIAQWDAEDAAAQMLVDFSQQGASPD
jgi:hypothetical protein